MGLDTPPSRGGHRSRDLGKAGTGRRIFDWHCTNMGAGSDYPARIGSKNTAAMQTPVPNQATKISKSS